MRMDRTMEGPMRWRTALVAGIIAGGTLTGCALAALAVATTKWVLAGQPLVTAL
jgi:hypothetical protein